MTKPDYLDQLLSKAAETAGSDYKLAQYLDVNRATVSQWRSGKRTCPPGEVALMAQLVGMDPEAWGIRAIVAQYAGTPKGEKLAVALGKALAVTGAVLGSAGASACQAFDHFIRCIERLSSFPPSEPHFKATTV